MLVLIIVNPTNILHILLVTELLWSMLYSSSLLMTVLNDDANLLVIGLFILGFSVVDVGLGLIVSILQRLFINTDLLSYELNNVDKFYKQWSNFLYIPRYLWKI